MTNRGCMVSKRAIFCFGKRFWGRAAIKHKVRLRTITQPQIARLTGRYAFPVVLLGSWAVLGRVNLTPLPSRLTKAEAGSFQRLAAGQVTSTGHLDFSATTGAGLGPARLHQMTS